MTEEGVPRVYPGYDLQMIITTNSDRGKYVMTEEGVHRVYQGVRLTDDYDHKLRPW